MDKPKKRSRNHHKKSRKLIVKWKNYKSRHARRMKDEPYPDWVDKEGNLLPEKSFSKKNDGCQECVETKGAINSSQIEDSKFIFRSHHIRDSTFIADSTNCTNCNFSYEVKNGTDIEHSSQVTDSKNVTNSTIVTNSENVSFSKNVTNSTNVTQSEAISQSENVSHSEDCIGCKECYNCTMCRNVTNCHNCHNVTDSENVVNAVNSTMIFGSIDIANSKNLTNASNMTNATHCTDCKDHSDCTGEACFIIPKSPFEIALENKMFFSSKKIIERLYDLSNVGDLETYKASTKLLDVELYRADNYLYDIARYKLIFDEDGSDLDFRVDEEKFIPDSKALVEKAVNYLIKDKTSFQDDDIDSGLIDPEDGYAVRIADLVNANGDFKSVYEAGRDVARGVISYESMNEKDDKELEAYDEYVYSLGREEDERILCDPRGKDFADCQRKHDEIKKAVEGAKENKEKAGQVEQDEEIKAE